MYLHDLLRDVLGYRAKYDFFKYLALTILFIVVIIVAYIIYYFFEIVCAGLLIFQIYIYIKGKFYESSKDLIFALIVIYTLPVIITGYALIHYNLIMQDVDYLAEIWGDYPDKDKELLDYFRWGNNKKNEKKGDSFWDDIAKAVASEIADEIDPDNEVTELIEQELREYGKQPSNKEFKEQIREEKTDLELEIDDEIKQAGGIKDWQIDDFGSPKHFTLARKERQRRAYIALWIFIVLIIPYAMLWVTLPSLEWEDTP